MTEARCILPIEVRCATCGEWRHGAYGEVTPLGVVPLSFPPGWDREQCATCNGLERCPNCGRLESPPFVVTRFPLDGRVLSVCAPCQLLPAKEQRVIDRREAERRAAAPREEAGNGRE
jgi:hypothetical protein